MQIFVTSPDPIDCAIRLWNNPIRARKMITETQPIIACTQRHFQLELLRKVDGNTFSTPKSRMNHPVIKNFAIVNKMSLRWLYEHLEALYCLYEGFAFQNVPANLLLLDDQTRDIEIDYDKLQFYNFAKADDKKLDFRQLPIYTAYDKFLKVQGG